VSVSIELTGKVALVTGASRGIGRMIALRMAQAGGAVAVLATTEDRARPVADEITKAGGKAIALGADVADGAQAAAAVERTVKELGGLHIVVNNAGITKDGLFVRMAEEDFTRVVDVNLKGTFNVCKAAARGLLKTAGARIINITSIVGLTGNAGQANYAAAKAGLVGLTMSLAREFGGRGVTVNAIAPGFITTDMTSDLPEAVKQAALASIPLARFGVAEDIADTALFLASDRAAYITGQTLVVDGGMSL
jgi:3-oxoacyl-[acyl-carrier protein] reductase